MSLAKNLFLRGSLPLQLLACLVLLFGSGCISTYEFEPGPVDVKKLVGELERLEAEGPELPEGMEEEQDPPILIDFQWWPLFFLRGEAFARNDDDENYPPGYAHLDLRSYFPIFGAYHVDMTLYDENAEMYEHQDETSILWGLWQSTNERIVTPYGERAKWSHRFLWIFRWGPRVGYVTTPRVGTEEPSSP